MNSERLTLRVREVADLLGVSPLHVHRSIDRGDLTAVRLGKLVLVHRASVERLLEVAETAAHA